MPLDPKQARYGLREVKISKMLTDTAGGATYDNPVSLPAAQTLELVPQIQADELAGDDTIVSSFAQLDAFTGSIAFGKDNLDAEAVVFGGTRTDSGTTPNQVAEIYHSGGQTLPYFKIEGRVVDADGATTDMYVQLLKCKLTGASWSSGNKKYGEQSYEYKAIRRDYDSKIVVRQRRETGSALASTADSTAPTLTPTPADAATGVVVSSNMTWAASEDLRANTVNSGTVMVIKASDGTVVAGEVTYDAATDVITFNPTSNLDGATAYISIATTGIQDLAGNPLAANVVANFTTA